ncbi:MAG: tetratricopeptide repeat protein [Desulfosalsimonadaceae bacterium]
MAKIKCPLCGKAGARRKCSAHNEQLICPKCCAGLRNMECGECLYFKEAEKYLRSIPSREKEKRFLIELNPEVEDAVDKALCFVERGNIGEGETRMLKLFDKHPKNHHVLYGMGVICAFKGQNEAAVGYFSKATDIFPYFIEAHYNKAIAYQKLLDIPNMVKSFKEVIKKGNPENDIVKQSVKMVADFEQEIFRTQKISLDAYLKAQEIFETAYSYMEKKEWEKAINGFKECLRINAQAVQPHGNMGICYAALGRKTEALAVLDKALEIDPNYELARVNRIGIERQAEGEKLTMDNFRSVEYYKDFSLKKKSYIQSLCDSLIKNKPE